MTVEHSDYTLYSITKRIRDWREKAIPEATAEGQLSKLTDELWELREAIKAGNPVKILKEVCDLLVVGSNYADLTNTPFIPILVNTLIKNEARTWQKSSEGKYQHTEESVCSR